MKTRRQFAESDEAAARKPLTVNVRQASRLSGLGRSTLWKMIRSGVLNSVMVGHRRLIVFASLEALLLGRTPEETPEQKTAYRKWDEARHKERRNCPEN
jgi:excisionase family DNA binding protein